ncbi:hypothetical protein NMG60_11007414 [Bertholletia excelsa]
MAFNLRRQLNCDDCQSPPSRDIDEITPDKSLHPPNPKPYHHHSSILIPFSYVLGASFLLVICIIIAKRRRPNLNSWRRNQPVIEEDQEDFIDENQGAVLIHPIWYINTVGLDQPVINSIANFKYKKDEGLVQGAGCSICLNEFQEDETLRLLPKCSHAFHMACIDMWLRSHKNCPLCRAPIVSDENITQARESEPELTHLGQREEIRVENLGNYDGAGTSNGLASEELAVQGLLPRNGEFQVLSDLADHRPKEEENLPPVRRSASMDASSASGVYLGGCSNIQSVRAKRVNSKRVAKSSSMRSFLQKGSVSLKRSSSSSGIFSMGRRYSRSHDSILPL